MKQTKTFDKSEQEPTCKHRGMGGGSKLCFALRALCVWYIFLHMIYIYKDFPSPLNLFWFCQLKLLDKMAWALQLTIGSFLTCLPNISEILGHLSFPVNSFCVPNIYFTIIPPLANYNIPLMSFYLLDTITFYNVPQSSINLRQRDTMNYWSFPGTGGGDR